ncbi:hypothetical protein chiPu_0021994 [Chiloscyllium punctatum]|uniref:Uncharacterized protein n=1 Tax=Chiloscyllium punctatum TaxID=137246 RepID=A0A401RGW5_CHIPU|nr:hypothetical protein [Chiloscyllium punctatum]
MSLTEGGPHCLEARSLSLGMTGLDTADSSALQVRRWCRGLRLVWATQDPDRLLTWWMREGGFRLLGRSGNGRHRSKKYNASPQNGNVSLSVCLSVSPPQGRVMLGHSVPESWGEDTCV